MVLVKAASTAKELVLARTFGTGDTVDAFLIAYAVPTFAVSIVSGAIRWSLIPGYLQVRERDGQEAANALLRGVAFWAILVLTGIAAAVYLLSPSILAVIARGFSPQKLGLTRTILLALLPVIVLGGLANIWAAVLNAGNRLGIATVAAALPPIFVIALLLVAGDRAGAAPLYFGILAGYVAYASALAIALSASGVPILPRYSPFQGELRNVFSEYVPLMGGTILMSSAVIIDQAMAASLGTGSVATLGYAARVVSAILAILSGALGSVILPHFSQMAADQDWAAVRTTLRTYTRVILLVTIPLVVLLVILSKPLTALLFERGAFTATDTARVAQVQALLALQIPFYVLGTLHVRLVSAVRANSLLLRVTVITVPLNIGLNLLFMRYLGVAGIALSTSCVYLGSYLLVRYHLASLLRNRERRQPHVPVTH
jgi:putative peptidoglycan lipid II flippase